jgi:predicted phage terminase large subunit-like protein
MIKLTKDVIAGFVGSVLGSRFDGKTESAGFHKECWELCCGPDRFIAIAAPRGHAKSSAITLGYGLATLLFRERKFMLLVSDTESQAAQFLGLFKNELQENNDLIDLFDIKRDDKGMVKFSKDSETDIIVEFTDGTKFRILAKGSEQKLRGLIWNGSRPDIIMCDDIENDELVMNKDRRDKFKRWFRNALLPCLSDRGIVRLVGTVLHMDSLLESFMPNPSDRKTITVGLKQYSTLRLKWRGVKYKAHNDDFTELLWPEKKTSEFFKTEYEEARRNGALDGYSQEYLNQPLDESVGFYRRADFQAIRPEEKQLNLNYYIAADLAIAENEKADYSVFVVAGVDEDKRIHIRDVVRDRLDGRDIVEMFLQLQRAYNPLAVGVEDMQVSKSIGPFLREEMFRQNTFINLHLLKHGGKDKPMRSKSMQARMRAKGVKFDKSADWYPNFEDELLTFPRGKKDDQADAFAYIGLMLDMLIEAATPKEMEDERFADELEEAGLGNDGRNELTGY